MYFIQQGQMMKWEDAHYTLDQDQLSDVFDLYFVSLRGWTELSLCVGFILFFFKVSWVSLKSL